jgi:hypothetical protein
MSIDITFRKVTRIGFFFLCLTAVVLFISVKAEKNEIQSEKLIGVEYVDTVTKYESMIGTSGVRETLIQLQNEMKSNKKLENSCHPIVHTIGQKAYSELQSVPDALYYQDTVCNSGYTHGVLESYFASLDDITSDVGRVCDSSKTDFHMWQCFHGIGHGFMFFTNNDLPTSLAYCGDFSTKKADACANGVLMENFGGDGTIHASQYADMNGPNSPCLEIDTTFVIDCYVYAPTFYLLNNTDNYVGAIEWCDSAPIDYVDSCARGVGGQLMKDFITEIETVNSICKSLTQARARNCYEGASSFAIFYYGDNQLAKETCGKFEDYLGLCEYIVDNSGFTFVEGNYE